MSKHVYCIYKSVGRKHLEYFEFSTLLSDITNAVNSRPLTYSDSDFDDLCVLTPNSFLKLQACPRVTFGSLDQTELKAPTRKQLVESLNKRENLFDQFKEMWYDYYLLSLREHSRNVYPGDWEERIKIGEVVLISSANKPRHTWSLGRVTQLLTGTDGKTRIVKLRRAGGSDEEVYPLNLLYPLELSLLTEESVQEKTEPQAQMNKERPVRAAAEACKKRLRNH